MATRRRRRVREHQRRPHKRSRRPRLSRSSRFAKINIPEGALFARPFAAVRRRIGTSGESHRTAAPPPTSPSHPTLRSFLRSSCSLSRARGTARRGLWKWRAHQVGLLDGSLQFNHKNWETIPRTFSSSRSFRQFLRKPHGVRVRNSTEKIPHSSFNLKLKFICKCGSKAGKIPF